MIIFGTFGVFIYRKDKKVIKLIKKAPHNPMSVCAVVRGGNEGRTAGRKPVSIITERSTSPAHKARGIERSDAATINAARPILLCGKG